MHHEMGTIVFSCPNLSAINPGIKRAGMPMPLIRMRRTVELAKGRPSASTPKDEIYRESVQVRRSKTLLLTINHTHIVQRVVNVPHLEEQPKHKQRIR